VGEEGKSSILKTLVEEPVKLAIAVVFLGLIAALSLLAHWLIVSPIAARFHIAPSDDWVKIIDGAVVLLLSILFLGPWLFRQLPRHARGKVKPGRLNIWITELEDDTDKGECRRHIVFSLQKGLGTSAEILLTPFPRKAEESGNAGDDAIRAARNVQDFLQRKGGDLLLWGRVFHSNAPVLELHFVSADRDGGEGSRFQLASRSLILEADFGEELGMVLAAVVASATKPASERGKYGMDVLEPLALKLDPLVKKLPQFMNDDQRARLLFSAAAISFAIGENKQGSEELQYSAGLYRRLLDEHWTGENEQEKRVAVQDGLGNVLLRLGERNKSTKDLEDAKNYYLAVLEVRTYDQAPQDWAITKINLGSAFSRLGKVELETGTGDGVEQSNRAVTIYREVLDKQSENETPGSWARAQNNLADALTTLGRHKRDTSPLNEAVEKCDAAMRVWTRKDFPLGWAMAQKNRGDALTCLGELEIDTKHLKEAVEAYRYALKKFTRKKATHYHQLTQQGLDRAQQLLKERSGRRWWFTG